MPANKKLTPLLAGRTIKSVSPHENGLTVSFADGSTMRIKTGTTAPHKVPLDRTVRKVRQSGAVLKLDFVDRTTAEIDLAEATSSVMLRDADGVLEYAD